MCLQGEYLYAHQPHQPSLGSSLQIHNICPQKTKNVMPSWPNSGDSEVAVARWNQQHYALLSWGRLQHADRVRKTVENEWWGAAFSGRKWRIWIDFFKSSKSFRSMKSSRLALCPRISRTRVWLLAPNFQPMTYLHAQ